MKFLQNWYKDFVIVFYTSSMGILSSGYVITRLHADIGKLSLLSLIYFILFIGMSAIVSIVVLIDLKPSLIISFSHGLRWGLVFILLTLFVILSFIITTFTLIMTMWALAAYIY